MRAPTSRMSAASNATIVLTVGLVRPQAHSASQFAGSATGYRLKEGLMLGEVTDVLLDRHVVQTSVRTSELRQPGMAPYGVAGIHVDIVYDSSSLLPFMLFPFMAVDVAVAVLLPLPFQSERHGSSSQGAMMAVPAATSPGSES